jgi:hypothetical protein
MIVALTSNEFNNNRHASTSGIFSFNIIGVFRL